MYKYLFFFQLTKELGSDYVYQVNTSSNSFWTLMKSYQIKVYKEYEIYKNIFVIITTSTEKKIFKLRFICKNILNKTQLLKVFVLRHLT